jgi:hypothetical protein
VSILDRYLEYARAFEEVMADDDWTRLEPYFTEDSVHREGESADSDAKGRNQVLASLKASVDGFDRKMDLRELRFTEPPREEGDRILAKWEARYKKSGAPDVVIFGTETAVFRGDRICLLQDVFDPKAEAELAAWLNEHGAVLQDD